MTGDRTSVTLRALSGRPLADPDTRSMVIAAAHAIAERVGVPLLQVTADEQSITATLGAGRIESLGFAAELRRVTNRWHETHCGGDLWGAPPSDEPPPADVDDADAPWSVDGDWWKRA